MYKGRSIFIATKHKKETVIAPLLQSKLGAYCYTSDFLDTDILGTFSGEISRKEDALSTLRNKCILGHKLTNCDLVVASEGSFGAHPTLFFAAADEELVMLKDFKNDLEIVGRELTLETNMDSEIILTQANLIDFAKKINFPSHGIILKLEENNSTKIRKEFKDIDDLLLLYNTLKNQDGNITAETDMRALYNPTRMKAIKKATENLIAKIKNECPRCKTPGFDIISAKPGLPCEICSFPTRSTLSYTYQCKKCAYTHEKKFPRGIEKEDPTYCDNCNP